MSSKSPISWYSPRLLRRVAAYVCGRGFAPRMSFAGREQPLSGRGAVAFTPAINWWGFLSAYLHSIQIIFSGFPAHPQHAPISTPANSVYLFRHRTFTVSFNRTPKNLSVITVNSVPGHSAISTRRPPFSIISQLRCISSFTSLGVAGYSPSRPLQRCALPTRWATLNNVVRVPYSPLRFSHAFRLRHRVL